MANDVQSQGSVHPSLMDAAIIQLYRGELARSDRWRTRLDTTTNWALTTTAAVVSFGLGNPASPHVTFLVGIGLVLTFLLLEARRYRYYDLWIRRVRLLETGYFVPAIRREPPDPDVLRELASAVERPQIQLTLFSAVMTRLNRAYGPILAVLICAWLLKLWAHPARPASISEFASRAHTGPLHGYVVLLIIGGLSFLLIALFITSLYTRAPVGELRARRPSRALPLWQRFLRPYGVPTPRRLNRPTQNA